MTEPKRPTTGIEHAFNFVAFTLAVLAVTTYVAILFKVIRWIWGIV